MWVSPIIPSDTTADRRDSIAASTAMVNAGESIFWIRFIDMEGTWNDGKDESSSPYTLPIVFTGSFAKYTVAVVVIIATREPGILSVILGHMSIITTAAIPMREAERFIVFMFLAYTIILFKNSDGTDAMSIPKKSLSCPTKSVTAIPQVNPVVIVYGMYLMSEPKWQIPIITRMIPASIVATISPSVPYWATIP